MGAGKADRTKLQDATGTCHHFDGTAVYRMLTKDIFMFHE